MNKYLKKYEEYESPYDDDDESYYHDDDYLFGRPNHSKKKFSKDEEEGDDWEEEDDDDDGDFIEDKDRTAHDFDEESQSDMENLLYLLRTYFENQGIEVDVENKGLDITLYTVMNKKDKLKSIVDIFNIVKKVKRDILPQYDSEFELWYSKDGRPMLYFNFDYEEGLSDDNPF